MAHKFTVIADVFERAGLVPHETPQSRWSVTVSDTATAPSPAARLDVTRSKLVLCAACGGTHTRRIGSADQFGKEQWRLIELACDDCGAVSRWQWDAW